MLLTFRLSILHLKTTRKNALTKQSAFLNQQFLDAHQLIFAELFDDLRWYFQCWSKYFDYRYEPQAYPNYVSQAVLFHITNKK